MAHKTLIDGTAYDIKGGRTLVDGTEYSIKGGKTLIDGTGYDVNFKTFIFDPTKMSYIQDEFIEVINNGYASQLPLGCLITLNNARCNTYEVIGVNHDGTENTVDLMAHTQVGNEKFGSSQIYSSSSIRTWLNNDYFNMFDSSIRNISKTMSVITNGSDTVNDYVKLLSATEIGASSTTIFTGEGNKYPVFKTGSGTSGFTDVWRSAGSYDSYYMWLRSRYPYDTTYVWDVHYSGKLDTARHSNSEGVLPVLRF